MVELLWVNIPAVWGTISPPASDCRRQATEHWLDIGCITSQRRRRAMTAHGTAARRLGNSHQAVIAAGLGNEDKYANTVETKNVAWHSVDWLRNYLPKIDSSYKAKLQWNLMNEGFNTGLADMCAKPVFV